MKSRPVAAIPSNSPLANDPLLSRRQAAELLATSSKTLERWAANRTGPAFIRYSATTVKYRLSAITRWLEAQTISCGSD